MEEKINLKDLMDLFLHKSKYFVEEIKGHIGVDNETYGTQAEYNEIFKIYKHPGLPKNTFMRETWITDSYGDNDRLDNVEFVQAKEKLTTVYESI